MAKTPNIGLEEIDETEQVKIEAWKLIFNARLLDALIAEIKQEVASKATGAHGHDVSAIEGLQAALNGKMDAGTTFSLNDLSDVEVSGAPVGAALVKLAAGWGIKQGLIDASQLAEALIDKADATSVASALQEKADSSEVSTALQKKAPLTGAEFEDTPNVKDGEDSHQMVHAGNLADMASAAGVGGSSYPDAIYEHQTSSDTNGGYSTTSFAASTFNTTIRNENNVLTRSGNRFTAQADCWVEVSRLFYRTLKFQMAMTTSTTASDAVNVVAGYAEYSMMTGTIREFVPQGTSFDVRVRVAALASASNSAGVDPISGTASVAQLLAWGV